MHRKIVRFLSSKIQNTPAVPVETPMPVRTSGAKQYKTDNLVMNKSIPIPTPRDSINYFTAEIMYQKALVCVLEDKLKNEFPLLSSKMNFESLFSLFRI